MTKILVFPRRFTQNTSKYPLQEIRALNPKKKLQTQKTKFLLVFVFKTMKQCINKLRIFPKCSQSDCKAENKNNLQEFLTFYLKSRRKRENPLAPSSANPLLSKIGNELPVEA